jgi:hypothetical protein
VRRALMAIKTEDGKFKCGYCNKLYDELTLANKCRSSHDLIYVPLAMEDIKSIIAFMYHKDETQLTDRAVSQFMKYNTMTQRLK